MPGGAAGRGVPRGGRPAAGSGAGFLLWAFGSRWIPLLLVLAVRRRLLDGPRGYDPALWSMVVPLGTYAAAGADYGRVAGFGFLVDVAHVAVRAGLAAWCAVTVSMVRAFASGARVSGVGRRVRQDGR